jgi:hypothetical protein
MNRCTICGDSRRLLIDRKLVSGCAVAEVARFFTVDYACLVRHNNHHLTRQLAKCYEQRSMVEGYDLLDKIEGMMDQAQEMYDRNVKIDDALSLKCLSEIRATIDLLARISAMVTSARIAEAELKLKEVKIDTKEETEMWIHQAYSCLTSDEIRELNRILAKMK